MDKLRLGQVEAAIQALFQGNDGFRSFEALHLLDLIVKHLFKMVGVLAVDLHEHRIIAGCIVDIRDFRDVFKGRQHLIVVGAFLEEYPYERSDVVA